MWTQHLERHPPPTDRVPGLEHLADAALAEAVEDLVRTDGQLAPVAGEQQQQLIGCQPVDLDQVLAEALGVGESRRQILTDLLYLFCRKQLRATEHGQQGVDAVGGHGPCPGASRPRCGPKRGPALSLEVWSRVMDAPAEQRIPAGRASLAHDCRMWLLDWADLDGCS